MYAILIGKGITIMAKGAYKIPASMDTDFLDMELTLRGKDGVGLKPIPLKTIMFFFIGGMIGFVLLTKTFIMGGNIIQKALFVVLWVLALILLGKYDATKRMNMFLVPRLLSYMPRSNRYITTRMTSEATPFYQIVGIREIDDNGLVEYGDGTYGYWYRIVGAASILLFEEDKNAILNRVDNFYRKINTDCEVMFMTCKESQKVYRQLANLNRRYKKLDIKDPDLDVLVDEQFDVLKNYVGGTFKSIHQYMLIKGDNKEALMSVKNVLQSEVENSSFMIKQCVPLYGDDIIEVLQSVYQKD